MLFREIVLADLRANRGNIKGQLLMISFRLAHESSRWRGALWLPGRVVGVCYRVVIEWILGVELPWKARVGPGLTIFHGHSLVINDGAVIGSHVVLRQGVTIGHLRGGGESPVIEDRVEFGAGAVVIGDVTVGHDSKVGAGVVLRESVPPFSIVIAPEPIIRARRRPSEKQARDRD